MGRGGWQRSAIPLCYCDENNICKKLDLGPDMTNVHQALNIIARFCGLYAIRKFLQMLNDKKRVLPILMLVQDDAGHRDVEIECNSNATVTLLSSPMVPTHPLYNIISCCKMKIHEPWCCAIKHIYREQNVAAYALVARSYNLGLGLHVMRCLTSLKILMLRMLGAL
ncbi:hypothetical protein L3X38_032141 [Prunus dulcis]|uniref:RNase H type-1 domain-containing protein n=1 Tax=Prunus dulcis TaxID=3755 RepID=A0AAD4VDG3_PRUDU|nr:hypothetical protein L3X38_032141 [Prunus dulcis]